MTSTIASYTKTTGAVKDYVVDWQARLSDYGDLLASCSWSVTPSGLTIGAGAYAPTIGSDGKSATVWLSGGTPGTTYTVTCHGTTNNVPPREDDLSIAVTIEVGVIVTDVSQYFLSAQRDLGCDGTGVAECFAQLQAGLDSLETTGGTLFVEPGKYKVTQSGAEGLTVPRGVTITGPERGWTGGSQQLSSPADIRQGPEFQIYGTGIGVTLYQQATLANLGFFYPTQLNTGSPTVFDYTIDMGRMSSVRNVYAINPYRFARIADNGGSISRVYAYPLNMGIMLGRCPDVVTISDVHFSPNTYYSASAALQAYVLANGTGLGIDGPEEFQIVNFFVYGYAAGIDFRDYDADGFRGVYGSWTGGGLDICTIAINVAEPNGLTLRGFRVSNVGIAANNNTYVGVRFVDTHVPASDDERPAIYMTNVSFWNSLSRAAWLVSGSAGIFSLVNGSVRGHANEAMRVESGTGHFDHVFAAAVRTGGAGTIVDVNALA